MKQLSTSKTYKTSSNMGGVFLIKYIKEENQIFYFQNVSPGFETQVYNVKSENLNDFLI